MSQKAAKDRRWSHSDCLFAKIFLCTWADEQTIREIYLKPFEISIKSNPGVATAVMSSFNFLGTVPTAACDQLLNTVLREEWGFEGFVSTDYFVGIGYQDADRFQHDLS